MALHHAALGFDSSSEVYERGRPDLPAAAVAFLTEQLRLAPGTRVLDIAAGTGKLTRPLAATGAHVIALEPLAGMRRTFRRLLPDAPLAAGIAEALPFDTGTMDAAVAGSAFHWFANAAALGEIRRVLVPGGRLALLWSVPDKTAPWVGEMLRIIDRHSGDTPLYRKGDWKRAIDAFDGLCDITHAVFPFVETDQPRRMRDAAASISFIASLPEAERARVLEDIRAVLARQAAESPDGAITMPYRADVFIYEAR